MWLKTNQMQTLDQALHAGKNTTLDEELFQLLRQKESGDAIATTCPQCHADLVRQMFPYLEVPVSACPQGHGAWMTEGVRTHIWELIRDHASVKARRCYTLRVLGLVLGCLTVFFLAVGIPYGTKMAITLSNYLDDRRVNENYWPKRVAEAYPALPAKGSVIDHVEELACIQEILSILEEGISNRLNMESVLRTHRSGQDYRRLSAVFQRRQSVVLNQLNNLSVPQRLTGIHRHLVTAVQSQMAFYADFTTEKIRHPSVTLNQMLQHPALRSTNQELWAAYQEWLALYPGLDAPTHQAIERRLCWFDII